MRVLIGRLRIKVRTVCGYVFWLLLDSCIAPFEWPRHGSTRRFCTAASTTVATAVKVRGRSCQDGSDHCGSPQFQESKCASWFVHTQQKESLGTFIEILSARLASPITKNNMCPTCQELLTFLVVVTSIDVSLAEQTSGPRLNSDEFSDGLPMDQRAAASALLMFERRWLMCPFQMPMSMSTSLNSFNDVLYL